MGAVQADPEFAGVYAQQQPLWGVLESKMIVFSFAIEIELAYASGCQLHAAFAAYSSRFAGSLSSDAERTSGSSCDPNSSRYIWRLDQVANCELGIPSA